jgi:SAM-dependent methyltransferase
LKLARTYPKSRFVGYDVYGPNVQRARAAAERAGFADRVRFAQVDGAVPLPSTFDLITMFDVLHDAVEPRALLASVRRALRDGGRVLCLEARSATPRAAFLHGVSVLYSLVTSLAHGGAGLGTCGLDEATLRELANAAGFLRVEHLAIDDPFHDLYVLA